MTTKHSPQANSGVWTALITPFQQDGTIDWPSFERLLIKQAEAQITGVVLGGTTGEAPTLRVQEKISLLRKAKALVGERLRIMAGVGGQCTNETIELAKLSRDAGADSLLVVTPPYNKPNPQGMTLHFHAIADGVDIPVCLYHVPGRTAQKLSAELIASICQHPRITMIKEASGDISFFSETKMLSKVEVLSGDDLTYLASLAVGGVGCISVLSNVFPREVQLMTDWWQAGNTTAALRMHEILYPLVQALFCETNPCPVKAALAEMNLCANVLRLPLAPITAEHQRGIRMVLGETKEKLAVFAEEQR
jgi:4-hydroxy-tetrahydrodipicolinate synthase